ncbi:TPA: Bax inhibitor-1/YccA family protein [Salmonella enterica subsp. enterica serovar Vinohrady]|uniref:Bax inhibitor-1 family protein n=1 Tax=Salmonella enterica TaxID=28901 RepID=UPI0016043721|nr:Bax inhibitor-1 family protein [Salmonella enterica]HCB5396954.1 Bax inhibitor-1/YccA family protein [Salmonella enterica subsp. enterica serovar Vinohrady]
MGPLAAIRIRQIAFIPATMLSLTYWYTALGLWCTAGIIWLTLYTHFLITHVQPVVVLWISALLLGLGYGAVTCVFRFGTVVATLIYIAIITLTGVSLAYLFSGGVTIFVIVGIMFSLNALFIFYLNISSGLFRPLIFMVVSGIIAAIVVNSLVASSTLVWIVSVLTVLVWTLITALEKSTLHGYARMLYHSEFSSLPRCALFGALTLYLGIINAVVTLCRYIILMILEILLSFRP